MINLYIKYQSQLSNNIELLLSSTGMTRLKWYGFFYLTEENGHLLGVDPGVVKETDMGVDVVVAPGTADDGTTEKNLETV